MTTYLHLFLSVFLSSSFSCNIGNKFAFHPISFSFIIITSYCFHGHLKFFDLNGSVWYIWRFRKSSLKICCLPVIHFNSWISPKSFNCFLIHFISKLRCMESTVLWRYFLQIILYKRVKGQKTKKYPWNKDAKWRNVKKGKRREARASHTFRRWLSKRLLTAEKEYIYEYIFLIFKESYPLFVKNGIH